MVILNGIITMGTMGAFVCRLTRLDRFEATTQLAFNINITGGHKNQTHRCILGTFHCYSVQIMHPLILLCW